MFIYIVASKTLVDAAAGWLDEFAKTSTCPECYHFDRSLRQTGFDVRVATHPGPSALNEVEPPGVSIARSDFLGLFAEESHRYLKLGKVLDEEGQQIPGYVSYIGLKPLLIRGGAKTRSLFCASCGAFRYVPMNDWYVLHRDLTEQTLYQTSQGGLAMTDELRKKISKGVWKGILIGRLPVVEQPQDGIVEFPENYYYWGARA